MANYIEPFCGSAAMLLCRPTPGRIETINDQDCYVANFWRATGQDPEAVAFYADGPVNEADLHSRHRWLVLSAASDEFRQRMRTDPNYFDAQFAGWWCWGLCCWIGGGWCTSHGATVDGDRKQVIPEIRQNGKGVTCAPPVQLPNLSGDAGASGCGVHASAGDKRPHIATGNGVGTGVNRLVEKRPSQTGAGHGPGVHQLDQKRPRAHRENGSNSGGSLPGVHSPAPDSLTQKVPNCDARGLNSQVSDANRPQLADAFSRGRGVHGNDHAGTCEARRQWLVNWFGDLRDRLRTVRVCCGNWLRVCDSHSVTTRLGITGVFYDPPYPTHAADGTQSRNGNLYATDSAGRDALDEIRDGVLAYCLERGPDPLMRIAVCGYDTDGYAALEAEGWSVVAWKAHGGYGNRSEKGRENAGRERIWFSPHCINPEAELPLFKGFA